MTHRRTLTTFLAMLMLGGLMLPARAHAGWKVGRAVAMAEVMWHPACGDLHVVFETPPAGLEDPAGWAISGECVVHLDRSRDWAWEPFCDTVLHEAGHVAGRPHSANPHSIMYPSGVFEHIRGRVRGRLVEDHWSGADRRCDHRGRPYLLHHLDALAGLAGG